MKNAYIFHGMDCGPDFYWYPWLADELKQAGYEVSIPALPTLNHEPVEETLARLDLELTSETILIGHSAGAPLILSILERSSTPVHLAAAVAGFMSQIDPANPYPILQTNYNADSIRTNCRRFVFFNSTDDRWGCNELKGIEMQKTFGGDLIICEDGHFGSTSFNQPHRAFPELLEEILT